MSAYIDKISREVKIVNGIVQKLDDLSCSFSETGNFHLSEKLGRMSEVLYQSATRIKDSSREEANERFKEAQQSAYNTLGAALAMSKLKEDGA
jgi:hypothetical protein